MVPVIIIPILNRPDLLDRCLKSIDYPVENLIVVDNGGVYSADMLASVVDRQMVKKSYVWSFPSNLGVATSWNLCIKATPFSDGWLLFNSDAWFEAGQLEIFLADCARDKVTVAGVPDWCCAWVGRDVVAKVGLFCEQFHPAYFEDWDYERRAVAAGVEVVHSDAVIGHDQSSTVKSDPTFFDPLYRERFSAGKKLYYTRKEFNINDTEWDLSRRCRLGWETR